MSYYPYGCEDEPVYNCPEDGCVTLPELANVRQVGYVNKNWAFTDPSSPVEWAAAIAAGMAHILPNTNGEYENTPIKVAGFGAVEERVIGHDMKLMYEDGNYLINVGFYNILQFTTGKYRVAFLTETKIWLSDTGVTVAPAMKVSRNVKAPLESVKEVKWTQKLLMVPYDIPAGIFVCNPQQV
jgi:hypothetical protein